jgi:lipoprotein NlpI
MRKAAFVLGALILSCVPTHARCTNAACNAVADRCNATDKIYTKQIIDASHSISTGADATGPESRKSIAAADALVRLWQNGDCAAMMNLSRLSGLADQIAREKNEAALVRVTRATAYFAKGDYDRAIDDYSDAIQLTPIVIIPKTNANLDVYSRRGFVYYTKGEIDHAMADYNEAIRLDARSSSAYFRRGIAYLYTGMLSKALADFNQANALNPKDAYIALWLDFVGKRNNLPSRLPQAITQLDMTKWPAPIIRLYLGEMNPAAVLAAATDPVPETNKRLICDANFYTGELALQQDRKDEAVRLFKLVASDCIGFPAAKAELKALNVAY